MYAGKTYAVTTSTEEILIRYWGRRVFQLSLTYYALPKLSGIELGYFRHVAV